MFFLFDENVPYKFVQGLALIEEANHKSKYKVQILHPRDNLTEGTSDEDQILLAGKHNGVIVSFDKDFKHMKSYYPLYKQFNVGAVVFNLAKKDFNYWGIVKTIILRWEELKIRIQESDRPFIFEITSRGIEKRSF